MVARCVSSSGLGCGHWREFVYAWRQSWPEILVGLGIVIALIAAGTRYRPLLPFGVGLCIALIVGFVAYYISL